VAASGIGTASASRSPGRHMQQHERIDSSIDACYEAILTPDTWPDALHRLARSLDTACTMFYPRNPDTGSHDPRSPTRPVLQMPISPDYQDLLPKYLTEGWYLDHYRAERGFPLLDNGRKTVVVEHDLATDEERRRLKVYNELYASIQSSRRAAEFCEAPERRADFAGGFGLARASGSSAQWMEVPAASADRGICRGLRVFRCAAHRGSGWADASRIRAAASGCSPRRSASTRALQDSEV
jgi:hypothetical protein